MLSIKVSRCASCWILFGLVQSFWTAAAVAQLPPTLPNPRLNWLFPAGGFYEREAMPTRRKRPWRSRLRGGGPCALTTP